MREDATGGRQRQEEIAGVVVNRAAQSFGRCGLGCGECRGVAKKVAASTSARGRRVNCASGRTRGSSRRMTPMAEHDVKWRKVGARELIKTPRQNLTTCNGCCRTSAHSSSWHSISQILSSFLWTLKLQARCSEHRRHQPILPFARAALDKMVSIQSPP